MIKGRYSFAGKVVEVHSLYEEVHHYCKDYQSSLPPDFTVSTTQEDIEYERSRAEFNTSDDAYLEELAVYRRISEIMPSYDTVLYHGSVIAVDGTAYMFTASSGTGKSTHTALWRKLFGERAIMVNDDKPLIHIDDTATAYGTPYNGKHRLSANIGVPLKAICILERSEENHIEQITMKEAYPMLIQQVYRPNDVFALQKTMSLVDKLGRSVKFYRLRCNMDISAAQISYDGMNKV